jgi:hypothetical protein
MKNKPGASMNTQELLAKLELIEVQSRVTLALVKDIRRMLAAQANPEDTLELQLPAEPEGRKAA